MVWLAIAYCLTRLQKKDQPPMLTWNSHVYIKYLYKQAQASPATTAPKRERSATEYTMIFGTRTTLGISKFRHVKQRQLLVFERLRTTMSCYLRILVLLT